jgi:hypothetical protein
MLNTTVATTVTIKVSEFGSFSRPATSMKTMLASPRGALDDGRLVVLCQRPEEQAPAEAGDEAAASRELGQRVGSEREGGLTHPVACEVGAKCLSRSRGRHSRHSGWPTTPHSRWRKGARFALRAGRTATVRFIRFNGAAIRHVDEPRDAGDVVAARC